MRDTEIQIMMQSLAEIHEKFLAKNYELSQLDINATRNLIERLYPQLLVNITQREEQKVVEQPFPTPTSIEPTIPSSTSALTDDINDEIDEVFQPSVEQSITPSIARKANKNFQLGINEKIMFAKELFDDDVSTLTETIRQLTSFEKMEAAHQFFDQKLGPFLVDEGKDEEIIQDFRTIISRIFN